MNFKCLLGLVILGLLSQGILGRRKRGRRKCPPGYNLTRNSETCNSAKKKTPCCVNGKVSTSGDCWGYKVEVERMRVGLEQMLGRGLDVPCFEALNHLGNCDIQVYCEVCYDDDANRVSCNRRDNGTTGTYNRDPECTRDWHTGPYAFHQPYDNGDICTCGTKFMLTYESTTRNVIYSPGSHPNPPGTSFSGRGNNIRFYWPTVFQNMDNRPDIVPLAPSISEESCSSHPDLSSIFQPVPSPPLGAGVDFYYEGCPDGRGLRCGGGNKPCWKECTCSRNC